MMKFFIIYNQSTGNVIGHKTGNNEPILNDDEAFLIYEKQPDGWTGEGYKIIDGYLAQDLSYSPPVDVKGLRSTRRQLLADTDWTQIPDNGLSEETRAAWRTYRQQLRDLPEHPNWPDLQDDDWPNRPN